jgi:Neprosin
VNGTYIGYYPDPLHGTGPLSKYSNLIEFGGESVGTTIWPAEGSGRWNKSGYAEAAYVREPYYLSVGNKYLWDALTTDQSSPVCYTVTKPVYASGSGVHFYSGGPGGTGC